MPNTDQRQSSPFKIRAIYGQYNKEKMAVDLYIVGIRVGSSFNSPKHNSYEGGGFKISWSGLKGAIILDC